MKLQEAPQPDPIEKERVRPAKEMSKRTLQLREIALKMAQGRGLEA
jgi:hypothetical protein